MAFRSRLIGGLVLSLVLLAQAGKVQAQVTFFMSDQFTGDNVFPGPGLDDAGAIQRFQAVVRAHVLAQQQIELSIQYLKQHKAEILAGDNEIFNKVFGKFYVPGNEFEGQYERVTEQAEFGPDPIPFLVEADDNTIEELVDDTGFFSAHLRPGDTVFVGDKGTTPGDSPVGELRTVIAVTDDTVVLDVPLIGDYTGAVVFRVNKVVQSPNQSYFEEVLFGYETLRDAMAQFTTYGDGQQFDFTTFAAGTDEFTPFSASMLLNFGVLPDRRFREAGASNSDSPDNRAANALDELLAWWDDNDDPSRGNLFYQAAMTVINEEDSQNDFFIGQAFDRETIEFFGDFVDGTPTTRDDVGPTQFADGSKKSQWQMIMEAFGESTGWSFKGVMEMQDALGLTNGTPNFFESFDAGNYAQFSELITTVGGFGAGGGGPLIGGGLEPENKRGSTTGFKPLVPTL